MKLYISRLIYLILLIGISFSCEHGLNEPPVTSFNKSSQGGPIDIVTARQWFQKSVLKKESPNSREITDDKRSVIWDQAKDLTYQSGKDVLMIPLYDDPKNHAVYELHLNTDDKSENFGKEYRLTRNFSYLLIYKNQDGNFDSEIVIAVPDQDYLVRNNFAVDSKNFSGALLVQTWTGQPKRVYKLVDGVVQGGGHITTDRPVGAQSSGGRITCSYVPVYIYQYVEVGCPAAAGGSGSSGGQTGPCYELDQTGTNYVSICTSGGGGGGGDSGDGTADGGGGGSNTMADVPPASAYSDYEYSMSENAIQALYNQVTGDPIELYLIAKSRNSNVLNLSVFSTSTGSIQIGPYNLLPHYDKYSNLLFYSAANQNRNVGPEYLIRPNAVGLFSKYIKHYTAAANLFYMNGIPSDGQIQIATGNYLAGLASMWGNALTSAEYWAYLITAFGEVASVKPPAIADAVAKTTISDASLANMINMLRNASSKQGFYTFGTANAVEADIMGAAWVGPNFRVSTSSQGATIWISTDNLRQYRSPVQKRSGVTQANFERRDNPNSSWPHNGHLDVVP